MKFDRKDIAERAYVLWCTAGRPAGRDLEFWLQAEAELMAARRARHPKDGPKKPDALRDSSDS